MATPRGNIKRHFINTAIMRVKVDEFLAHKFHDVGYAGVEMQRTPLGTRVIIYAERPSRIIGRGGRTIKQLTNVLEHWFGVPNPQITVMRVEEPELNARVMAFRLASALQKGFHFRRAGYALLRRIMGAGAVGAQVKIDGKLTGERSRFEKYIAGKVYKSGNQVIRLVDRAIAHVKLKPGIEGVEVMIVKEGKTDDHVRIKEPSEVVDVVQKIKEEMGVTQEGEEGGQSQA